MLPADTATNIANRIWYGTKPGSRILAMLLLPLSWCFCLVAGLRRQAYRRGLLKTRSHPIPVIVVGNISVGGTGKTPLVIWLNAYLQDKGWRPGIVCRGYGGRARDWPVLVEAGSDPDQVGDEAVMLARRCPCPVVAGPDRSAAIDLLIEHGCNIAVSDDGLQHYALSRSLEIAIVDGRRQFGNGHCLPAGPLREPLSRLDSVDLLITHDGRGDMRPNMKLLVSHVHRLGKPEETCSLAAFTGRSVHAVAGIGHPQRFFDQLRSQGILVTEHPFADHYRYREKDLRKLEHKVVLMTEKDAVKCSAIADWAQVWYVEVEAQLSAQAETILNARLAALKQPD